MVLRFLLCVFIVNSGWNAAAQEVTLDQVHDLVNNAGSGTGIAIKRFHSGGYLQFSNHLDQIGPWHQVPFITRLDENGSVIWDHLIEPDPSDFGWFMAPGEGVDHLPHHGYVMTGTGSDQEALLTGFVVRLDEDGVEMWRRRITDGSGGVAPFMVRFNRDGGLYVKSWLIRESEMLSLMTKFSANGTMLWQKVLEPSGGESWSSSFCNEADGGFTMVGAMVEDDVSVPWLGRYDHNGELLWERSYTLPSAYTNFHLIEKDGGSGYYVKGSDKITLFTHLDADRDVFAHLDSLGQEVWFKYIGTHHRITGTSGFKVISDQGIVAFGVEYGGAPLPGANSCGLLIAINAAGDSLGSALVGHRIDSMEHTYMSRIHDMLVDCDAERVLLVGGTNGTPMQGWTTLEDPWLVMVDLLGYSSYACPMDPPSMAAAPGAMLTVFPNPVRAGDPFTIQLPEGITGLVSLEIMAMDGRAQKIKAWRDLGEGIVGVDPVDLPPGIYFIQALVDDHVSDQTKVLILH